MFWHKSNPISRTKGGENAYLRNIIKKSPARSTKSCDLTNQLLKNTTNNQKGMDISLRISWSSVKVKMSIFCIQWWHFLNNLPSKSINVFIFHKKLLPAISSFYARCFHLHRNQQYECLRCQKYFHFSGDMTWTTRNVTYIPCLVKVQWTRHQVYQGNQVIIHHHYYFVIMFPAFTTYNVVKGAATQDYIFCRYRNKNYSYPRSIEPIVLIITLSYARHHSDLFTQPLSCSKKQAG